MYFVVEYTSFWKELFHAHKVLVEDSFVSPSLTLASTLKRIAVTWLHVSPSLQKGVLEGNINNKICFPIPI